MNVILIVADTLRRDHVGCYGSDVATPHIDALAAEGIVCDGHYAASFPTGPNRQDVHTGRFTFPYQRWSRIAPEDVSLGTALGESGVRTFLSADTPAIVHAGYADHFDDARLFRHWNEQLPPGPPGQRYELPAAPEKLRRPERVLNEMAHNAQRRDESDWYCARTARAAAGFLESRRDASPFFLCADTFDPHEPWFPPPWYVNRYDPGFTGERIIEPAYEPVETMDAAELRHMRALYAATVTMVDTWIGYLMWTVERLNLRDSTAVMVTTDHGFYLWEHGLVGKVHLDREDRIIGRYPLHEEMTHIPLIARIPGVTPGRCGAFTQPPDIMPTILELAGVALPAGVQGESLLPLFRGEKEAIRDWAVTSYTFLQDDDCRAPSALTTSDGTYLYGGDEHDPMLSDTAGADAPPIAEMHERYLRVLGEIDCPAGRIDSRRDPVRRPESANVVPKLL